MENLYYVGTWRSYEHLYIISRLQVNLPKYMVNQWKKYMIDNKIIKNHILWNRTRVCCPSSAMSALLYLWRIEDFNRNDNHFNLNKFYSISSINKSRRSQVK